MEFDEFPAHLWSGQLCLANCIQLAQYSHQIELALDSLSALLIDFSTSAPINSNFQHNEVSTLLLPPLYPQLKIFWST